MTDLLNTVDVKISANSRSFNVDVHVYEHCSTEKIDQVIANAIYCMKETQHRIKSELMAEAKSISHITLVLIHGWKKNNKILTWSDAASS